MAATDSDGARSLQTHIEDMRSLTLCKICLKPFYEPYILACGHTYCYSCLRSWFSGNIENDRQKKKNCPDCRTVVKAAPAPNYLLRDLTHLFIGRTELLPEDESVGEHAKERSEEAKVLAKDKSGPGLFQGIFKDSNRPVAAPIIDYEDGVVRCPNCAYELEDDSCARCGYEADTDGALALSDLEDDNDDASDPEYHRAIRDLLRSTRPPRAPGPAFFAPEAETDYSDDTSDFGDGDNQYDLHDDFVDNEDEVDVEEDATIGGDYDNYPTDVATPYSLSNSGVDSDSEAGSPVSIGRSPPRRILAVPSDDDMIDEANELEDLIQLERSRARTRARPVVYSDDDDDLEPLSHEPSHGESNARQRTRTMPRHLIPSSDDDDDDDDDDDTDEAERPSNQPFRGESTFAAPAFSDAEEEDDSDSDSSSVSADPSRSTHGIRLSDSDDSDDSDDTDNTVTPPQPAQDRRQRLHDQRSRRPKPSSRITIDLVTPPSRNQSHGQAANAARAGRRTTRVY